MSSRTKAQASVTYYDSANYTSAQRTAVVAFVNSVATALNADATPKAFPRKYRAIVNSLPTGKGAKTASTTVLQGEVNLVDSAKWDSTTRSAVVAWLQAIAVKLTNDATPKSFKRTQTFNFSR